MAERHHAAAGGLSLGLALVLSAGGCARVHATVHEREELIRTETETAYLPTVRHVTAEWRGGDLAATAVDAHRCREQQVQVVRRWKHEEREARGVVWEWLGGGVLTVAGAGLLGARGELSDELSGDEDLSARGKATAAGALALVGGAVVLGFATYHQVDARDRVSERRLERRVVDETERDCRREPAAGARAELRLAGASVLAATLGPAGEHVFTESSLKPLLGAAACTAALGPLSLVVGSATVGVDPEPFVQRYFAALSGRADAAGTSDALLRFAEGCPLAPQAGGARTRAEQLDFPGVQASDDPDRLRWFRKRHPEGRHAEEVAEREASLRLDRLGKDATEAELHGLFEALPSTTAGRTARGRAAELGWRRLRRSRDVAALQAFEARYTGTEAAAEAGERREALQSEAVLREIRRSRDLHALHGYYRQGPKVVSEAARRRARQLRGSEVRALAVAERLKSRRLAKADVVFCRVEDGVLLYEMPMRLLGTLSAAVDFEGTVNQRSRAANQLNKYLGRVVPGVRRGDDRARCSRPWYL